MDEDYIYDECCPEEAEFLHYEGGDSFADDYDDYYDDDYPETELHHHTSSHRDSSNVGTNAAMLGAAYMAGRAYSRREPRSYESNWDRSMAKYRQKWHDDKTGKRPVSSPRTNTSVKGTKASDYFSLIIFGIIIGLIVSLIIGFIIWPILHIFFFCDDFICTHHSSFGITGIMTSTTIITVMIVLGFLFDPDINK